jgi:CrcB protein
MSLLAYIGIGGLLGSLGRYLLQGWIQDRLSGLFFPAGTLVVNVTGTFALGFLLRYATGTVVLSPELRAGLGVGLCGAFTTMSTFSYETMALIWDGEYWQAGLYGMGTLAGCFAGLVIGTRLAAALL